MPKRTDDGELAHLFLKCLSAHDVLTKELLEEWGKSDGIPETPRQIADGCRRFLSLKGFNEADIFTVEGEGPTTCFRVKPGVRMKQVLMDVVDAYEKLLWKQQLDDQDRRPPKSDPAPALPAPKSSDCAAVTGEEEEEATREPFKAKKSHPSDSMAFQEDWPFDFRERKGLLFLWAVRKNLKEVSKKHRAATLADIRSTLFPRDPDSRQIPAYADFALVSLRAGHQSHFDPPFEFVRLRGVRYVRVTADFEPSYERLVRKYGQLEATEAYKRRTSHRPEKSGAASSD